MNKLAIGFKTLVALATLTFSFATFGALEKIGIVQVADVTALVGGITKLGEFSGNSMLGLIASSSVSKIPCVALFGPGRENVPFAISLFWNGDKAEYAIVYPIAQTQQQFLSAHSSKVGKDGVIALSPEKDENGKVIVKRCYVLFSADGKWVAYSDKKEQLALALKDVKLAERPMNGDLMKIAIDKSGMGVVRKMLDKATKEKKAGNGDKRLKDAISDCESLVCGAMVDDNGLAFRGMFRVVKGSTLAKCGLTPLAQDPLAFADKDALFACAVAKDCGQSYLDLEELLKLLAKYGIKTDFLKVEERGEVSRITLDIPAAATYFKGATNELAKIDVEQFRADFQKLMVGKDAFKAENPAMFCSLAIKDFSTPTTPAERVKRVLPELAGKQPYQIQVLSLYAIIKAVLPHVLNGMSTKERVMFTPILAMLPKPGNGGIASAIWREQEAHRFLTRVSADEFKSVSAGFSAFGVYQMQKKMQNPSKKNAKSK